MTTKEKDALLRAFDVMRETVVNTPVEGDGSTPWNPAITPPQIGPMYDNVSIHDRLTALPFSNEEFEAAVKDMDDAIKNQNRLAGALGTVTYVLSNVRQLLPMLLAI